jgi:hypothetical protein
MDEQRAVADALRGGKGDAGVELRRGMQGVLRHFLPFVF